MRKKYGVREKISELIVFGPEARGARWHRRQGKMDSQECNAGIETKSRARGSALAAGLLATTAIVLCSCLLQSQPAAAQVTTQGAAVRVFNIPAQPLAGALNAFGRQSGLQVTLAAATTRGVNSRPVNGSFTPQQALAQMLEGTGIPFRITSDRTAVVGASQAIGGSSAAPAGAISLDTIDVQGETAWGPVNGFVASRSATGSKTDTPIIEVPQSISVVTRDQIAARQVQSLTETLNYTAGVYAGYSGHQQFSPRFSIRGLEADTFNGSAYLNGLPSSGFGGVEPFGLERVEVMRGPASVLYGQGQPTGVIGLVTKRPIETPIHEFQVQGGSYEQRGGAFDFGGPMTEDRTLLYRFTGLARDGGTGIDFSNEKRAFLSGAVTWRPTTETEITAYSLYQKDQGKWIYGLPARGTVLPNPNGRIPLTRYIGEPSTDYNNTEKTVIGYNLQHRATDSLVFRQNAQYSRDTWDWRDISPDGLRTDLRTLDRFPDEGSRSLGTFAIDNQAELKAITGVLHHTVLFGVDYRRRTDSNQGIGWDSIADPIDLFAPVYGSPIIWSTDKVGSRQSQNLTGVYLQDQIKLDRWILTLGGRYDWVDSKTVNVVSGSTITQHNEAFTKRAGLGYEFDSGVVPYISYANSFVPISGTTYDLTPYKPETGRQYEAGIKYQPKGAKWRVTAAVYDLKKQNVLTQDVAHPGYSIQIGEISSRGFEFETVASLTSNLNLTAAYSYNDVRVTESNDANFGKRPVRTPPHLASIWADYTIREGALNGLGFGGGVRYVAATAGDWTNTFIVPAYTVVDAMVRYDIDNWRFSINATNLFDNQYIAGCASALQCNVGRMRTVLGKVSYRW